MQNKKIAQDGKTILGKNIQNARKKNNLTQQQFATLISKNISSVAKYESGIRCPGVLTLAKIADVLECSVSDLVGR